MDIGKSGKEDVLDFLLFRKDFKECTVPKPPAPVFCVVSILLAYGMFLNSPDRLTETG